MRPCERIFHGEEIISIENDGLVVEVNNDHLLGVIRDEKLLDHLRSSVFGP